MTVEPTSETELFDLYVWRAPRDVDPDRADALIRDWHAAGADPAASPFEPSTDIGWFHRELKQDLPEVQTTTDAVRSTSSTPIWLSATDEPPARMVAIRLSPTGARDELEEVFSLAAKYDLILFDPRNRRLIQPLEAMADHASATFWPGGALQAAVAGGAGVAIALIAWFLSIPLLSGVALAIGVFLFVGAVYTFVHEIRKGRRSEAG